MITRDKAFEITKEFSSDIVSEIGDLILAIYVFGSLGGDYYRVGQSDIDTIIITKNKLSEAHLAFINRTAQDYQKKYHVPKGFGAIVVEKMKLYPPYNPKDELILEIINLKKQGLLIYGDFDINMIPMPDKKAIIADANVFEDWWDNEFQPTEPLSFVACTNSIIILLKRYLLIKEDIIEFNKFKVIPTYLNNNPPIVNNKVFTFISRLINQEISDFTKDELIEMNEFHKELRKTMNQILLSR